MTQKVYNRTALMVSKDCWYEIKNQHNITYSFNTRLVSHKPLHKTRTIMIIIKKNKCWQNSGFV